jgi:hypothetical protein
VPDKAARKLGLDHFKATTLDFTVKHDAHSWLTDHATPAG